MVHIAVELLGDVIKQLLKPKVCIIRLCGDLYVTNGYLQEDTEEGD